MLVELHHIRSRVTGEVFAAWRAYQRELHARGATDEAERLYYSVTTMLDLADDDELDELALHSLALGGYSPGRRPALISRLSVSPSHKPDVGDRATDDPEPVKPAKPASPQRPPLSDDELVEMHREAQAALSHGETAWAISCQLELERELVRACDLDVLNDGDIIDRLLDELHSRAFPAPTRPPRLEIERASPFE
jgi:hypothetical protein